MCELVFDFQPPSRVHFPKGYYRTMGISKASENKPPQQIDHKRLNAIIICREIIRDPGGIAAADGQLKGI